MNRATQKDISNLITNTSLSFILYAVLLLFNVNNKLVFIVFVLVMLSNLYRSKSLGFIFNRIAKTDLSKERIELINTISSLQNYKLKTEKWNGRRKVLYNTLPQQHKQIAKQINYLDRVDKIEHAISTNSIIVDDIASAAIDEYEVTPAEMRIAVPSKQNFRIIETLCHYQRDWSTVGEKEIKPILKFFTDSLNQISQLDKNVKRGNTIVVVPGSGLGRAAHEIALQNYCQVHAIEFSLLMFLFNNFIYNKTHTKDNGYTIYPFIHSYSHHISLEDQLRTIQLNVGLNKPSNLSLHHQDFRKFELHSDSQSQEAENVIIVTEFFVDTAENIFEYLDAITRIIGDKKAYWVNLGPLKYGSSPKIEPTLNEWKKLRKLYGWSDIEDINPLDGPLIGYLTDKKSLWQGNYGVARWVSRFEKSFNK